MNSLNPLEPRKKEEKLYIFHYTRDPYFMAYENNPFHNSVRFHQQQIPEKNSHARPWLSIAQRNGYFLGCPPSQ